jgi:ABC-type multidrug transport system fused ATPase/permease subunit
MESEKAIKLSKGGQMIQKFIARLNLSTIAKCIQVLEKRDRRKLVIAIFAQLVFSFLDLIGVALIGIIGSLSISGIRSSPPAASVQSLLTNLKIEEYSFQGQVAILGALAALVLILRTILSVIVTRKIIFFLSRRGTTISSQLTYKFLAKDLPDIQSRSTQGVIFSLTNGVQIITIGILGAGLIFIADGILLMVLFIGLLVVDPVTSLATLLIFSFVSVAIYRLTSSKAVKLGRLNSDLSIKSNELLFEVLSSFREAVVGNRREYYAKEIGKVRQSIGFTNAEIAFMPNISKYATESTVIIGAVITCGLQFVLQDSIQAISTLAIFLAAGTRIAPAVMRMQQGIMVIKSNIGSANPTLELMDFLKESERLNEVVEKADDNHTGFTPSIEVEELDWSYPDSKVLALTNVNLRIESGDVIAVVGPSGAGKTTLADALLGVLPISKGSIRISGLPPKDCVRRWPGAISYVPQEVMVANGTVRENVALGYPIHEVDDVLVWEALETAQLRDFVESLPQRLDSVLGDRGMKISGGQRQRLGIARALFTKPKLLFLDEATSSLDGQTEADISSAIHRLKGSVTVIMIAHRLSTVREANRVMYIEQGKILCEGTFEEVRRNVPDFDKQANLMGL